jgi:hypothetical protein
LSRWKVELLLALALPPLGAGPTATAELTVTAGDALGTAFECGTLPICRIRRMGKNRFLSEPNLSNN